MLQLIPVESYLTKYITIQYPKLYYITFISQQYLFPISKSDALITPIDVSSFVHLDINL